MNGDYLNFKVSCRDGDSVTVGNLLKKVDPSLYQNEPIRIASENGHLKVVELLLKDPRVGGI